MKYVALVLTLGLSVAACDRPARSPLPRPSTVPEFAPTLPPPSPPQSQIELGETHGTFVGQSLVFELIAPSRGTLVIRLDWTLIDSFLVLGVDGNIAGWRPPVVGKVAVEAGQRVVIAIGGGGTDHEYNDKFVLTTSIE